MHLYQSALMNKAALAAVGYTRDTPNPPGGEIVRDRSGEPDCACSLRLPRASLLYSTLSKGPILGDEQKLESTRHFFRELENRFGLHQRYRRCRWVPGLPG